jgi:hypothetical protein
MVEISALGLKYHKMRDKGRLDRNPRTIVEQVAIWVEEARLMAYRDGWEDAIRSSQPEAPTSRETYGEILVRLSKEMGGGRDRD